MNVQHLPLDRIRTLGLEALARELGPVGLARFLQQFETGSGDYTRARADWLKEEDVKTLADKVTKARK
ncbi:MAG: hypothetical protein JXB85_13985 [Anaerolineales bacterium]|nr:hypothetical protein [Anaerolineales bacterium]